MYRLYVNSGNLILTANYLRRVRVVGRSFAAATTFFLTVVTPSAPAAQSLAVSPRRLCRGQTLAGYDQLGRCSAEQSTY
jgi:hypothetical protein